MKLVGCSGVKKREKERVEKKEIEK